MSNLLGVSIDQFLGQPLIAVGVILLIIGLVTIVLAKRITRVARQSNKISNSDKLYVTLKIVGLLVMLAGFICVSINIITYIVNK